jgi:hypothetical protein
VVQGQQVAGRVEASDGKAGEDGAGAGALGRQEPPAPDREGDEDHEGYGVAQDQESERRAMLQPDLGDDGAAAPQQHKG